MAIAFQQKVIATSRLLYRVPRISDPEVSRDDMTNRTEVQMLVEGPWRKVIRDGYEKGMKHIQAQCKRSSMKVLSTDASQIL